MITIVIEINKWIKNKCLLTNIYKMKIYLVVQEHKILLKIIFNLVVVEIYLRLLLIFKN